MFLLWLVRFIEFDRLFDSACSNKTSLVASLEISFTSKADNGLDPPLGKENSLLLSTDLEVSDILVSRARCVSKRGYKLSEE